MLTAKKSAWFEKIFAIYCHNLFKRRFHSLKISGSEFLKNRDKNIPTVIYCNHSSWWDGLVAFKISQAVNTDSYVMMEEKQLKNLQPFRRIGAFSVIRENPREAVKSINYAVNLLKEKQNRTLWIFPQGEILPNDLRPIEFFNGISRIIEKTGKCYAVALAIRYEFLGEYKPQIFVKIAEPELINIEKNFDSKEQTKIFASLLVKTLDDLKKDVSLTNLVEYKPII